MLLYCHIISLTKSHFQVEIEIFFGVVFKVTKYDKIA